LPGAKVHDLLADVRWPVRRAAAAVVGLSLLAACSTGSGKSGPPGATVGTAPPQTTTTDPYAVPAVIDAAYVNRVLAGLDAANGDIVRLLVSTKTITPEMIERLKALYIDRDLLQLQIDSMQTDLHRGLTGVKPNPGNSLTTVSEFITKSPSCVYAKVFRDATLVAVSPDPRFATQWVALKPAPAISSLNPTGWAYVYEGFQRDLTAPTKNPCSE
jgi:hypothetical protein